MNFLLWRMCYICKLSRFFFSTRFYKCHNSVPVVAMHHFDYLEVTYKISFSIIWMLRLGKILKWWNLGTIFFPFFHELNRDHQHLSLHLFFSLLTINLAELDFLYNWPSVTLIFRHLSPPPGILIIWLRWSEKWHLLILGWTFLSTSN